MRLSVPFRSNGKLGRFGQQEQVEGKSPSTVRPTRGPTIAETTSAPEKAAKNHVLETPTSRAMRSARMAGK
jgi:hypothetical protein